MTRASHLAARIATNAALDRIHAQWVAAAPPPPRDLRKERDRRAIARMYPESVGRRRPENEAEWLELADRNCA